MITEFSDKMPLNNSGKTEPSSKPGQTGARVEVRRLSMRDQTRRELNFKERMRANECRRVRGQTRDRVPTIFIKISADSDFSGAHASPKVHESRRHAVHESFKPSGSKVLNSQFY